MALDSRAVPTNFWRGMPLELVGGSQAVARPDYVCGKQQRHRLCGYYLDGRRNTGGIGLGQVLHKMLLIRN